MQLIKRNRSQSIWNNTQFIMEVKQCLYAGHITLFMVHDIYVTFLRSLHSQRNALTIYTQRDLTGSWTLVCSQRNRRIYAGIISPSRSHKRNNIYIRCLLDAGDESSNDIRCSPSHNHNHSRSTQTQVNGT